MNRTTLDVLGDLLVGGGVLLIPPTVFGLLLVFVTARSLPKLVEPARAATSSSSMVCSILSLGAAVYRPLGVDTPVSEVSIFAVAVAYSLGPALVGAVLVFVAAITELALVRFRGSRRA